MYIELLYTNKPVQTRKWQRNEQNDLLKESKYPVDMTTKVTGKNLSIEKRYGMRQLITKDQRTRMWTTKCYYIAFKQRAI